MTPPMKISLRQIGGFCGVIVGLMSGLQARAEEPGADETTPTAPAEPAAAQSRGEVTTPTGRAPSWKITGNSYFYDFNGTRPANDNLYSFGKSDLFLQLLSLEHQIGDWTLMVVGQYLNNFVETNLMGMTFKDTTRGIGDTTLMAVRPLLASGPLMMLGDVGVSLPTGSINQVNANNPSLHYAYNMQLGSGTVDGSVGLTALLNTSPVNLGTRISTTVRTGQNANGYRLGNLHKLDGWAEIPVTRSLTPRLSGYYKFKNAIQGQDYTLARSALTEFYYSPQVDWNVSAALRFQQPLVGTTALSAEAGLPLIQGMRNVDNVVVSTNYYASLSLTGGF